MSFYCSESSSFLVQTNLGFRDLPSLEGSKLNTLGGLRDFTSYTSVGFQDVYTVISRFGYSFSLTPSHRIVVSLGSNSSQPSYMSVKDLSVGSPLIISLGSSSDEDHFLSSDSILSLFRDKIKVGVYLSEFLAFVEVFGVVKEEGVYFNFEKAPSDFFLLRFKSLLPLLFSDSSPIDRVDLVNLEISKFLLPSLKLSKVLTEFYLGTSSFSLLISKSSELSKCKFLNTIFSLLGWYNLQRRRFELFPSSPSNLIFYRMLLLDLGVFSTSYTLFSKKKNSALGVTPITPVVGVGRCTSCNSSVNLSILIEDSMSQKVFMSKVGPFSLRSDIPKGLSFLGKGVSSLVSKPYFMDEVVEITHKGSLEVVDINIGSDNLSVGGVLVGSF